MDVQSEILNELKKQNALLEEQKQIREDKIKQQLEEEDRLRKRRLQIQKTIENDKQIEQKLYDIYEERRDLEKSITYRQQNPYQYPFTRTYDGSRIQSELDEASLRYEQEKQQSIKQKERVEMLIKEGNELLKNYVNIRKQRLPTWEHFIGSGCNTH